MNPSYCNQKPAYALGEVDELTMGLTSACTKSAFRSPPPPPRVYRVYNSGDEFGEETNLSNISTEKTSKVLLHIPLKAY